MLDSTNAYIYRDPERKYCDNHADISTVANALIQLSEHSYRTTPSQQEERSGETEPSYFEEHLRPVEQENIIGSSPKQEKLTLRDVLARLQATLTEEQKTTLRPAIMMHLKEYQAEVRAIDDLPEVKAKVVQACFMKLQAVIKESVSATLLQQVTSIRTVSNNDMRNKRKMRAFFTSQPARVKGM